MVRKISCQLGAILNRYSPRNNVENSTICYGIELFLESGIKIGLLTIFGIILNLFYQTIGYLISFSLLRTQAGGIHAKSGLKCWAVMVGSWGTGVFFGKYVSLNTEAVCTIGSGCLIILYLLAPQYTEQSLQLTYERIHIKKIKAMFLTIAIIIMAYIKQELRGVLMIGLIIEVITVVLEGGKKWIKKY